MSKNKEQTKNLSEAISNSLEVWNQYLVNYKKTNSNDETLYECPIEVKEMTTAEESMN